MVGAVDRAQGCERRMRPTPPPESQSLAVPPDTHTIQPRGLPPAGRQATAVDKSLCFAVQRGVCGRERKVCGREQEVCGKERKVCGGEQGVCGREQEVCGEEQRVRGREWGALGDSQRSAAAR